MDDKILAPYKRIWFILFKFQILRAPYLSVYYTYCLLELDLALRSVSMNNLKCVVCAASGEPPLLLASSVHCATRAAVKEARRQYLSWGGVAKETDSVKFQHLDVPATLPVVKELCGLDMVERYLEWTMSRK